MLLTAVFLFLGVVSGAVSGLFGLGGGIVVVAYIVALGFASRLPDSVLPAGFPLLFCALPVILIGLSEDVTRRIHPWHRLAGAVASAAITSFFAGGII